MAQIEQWILKSVISGDTVVLRGQPVGGPPPELTVGLAYISTGKLARRPTLEQPISEEKDECGAWEARELIRKRFLGKKVLFQLDYVVPASGKKIGFLYVADTPGIGPNTPLSELPCINEILVSEGWAELRRRDTKSEITSKMVEAEDAAKANSRGKWASKPPSRPVPTLAEDVGELVSNFQNKPVKAIIEHVRDATTYRMLIPDTNTYITVSLSGVRGPKSDEQYNDEAKYFVESRLLQRDVDLVLEGISNPRIAFASVIHTKGNIAEALLKEGFAKCVDWSIGKLTGGAEAYRAAENEAKQVRKRLWKGYVAPTTAASTTASISVKNFKGKVIEIVNAEAMEVKLENGNYQKIFLSSVRGPKAPEDAKPAQQMGGSQPKQQRFRPLYDIPHMFDAREFLRKKLVGRKVDIKLDYIQPPQQGFPERMCCTVMLGDVNVAEALITRGLATVVYYRQDDDKRSQHYDILREAEEKAKKKSVGMFSKKPAPIYRVSDCNTKDKAQHLLSFLQQAGSVEAVVEYVVSANRFRCYIPKQSCVISFLLAGVECPANSRSVVRNGQTEKVPAEPFGEEAFSYSRDNVLQHTVQLRAEAIDRGGNFIGWMILEDHRNLSVVLIKEGFGRVHPSGLRSVFASELETSQESALQARKKYWSIEENVIAATGVSEADKNGNEDEGADGDVADETTDSKKAVELNFRKAKITAVKDDGSVVFQFVDLPTDIKSQLTVMAEDLEENPPLTGNVVPKKDEHCLVLDKETWHRAKIESVSAGTISLLLVDCGRRMSVTTTQVLASLPSHYDTKHITCQVTAAPLALVTWPADEEDRMNSIQVLRDEVEGKEVLLVKRTSDTISLFYPADQADIGRRLIEAGLALCESRRDRKLANLQTEYQSCQMAAKKSRVNLWRYGDFVGDEAPEFGVRR